MERAALPILQDALDTGVEPGLLHLAARRSKRAEALLWDAMLAPVHEARPGPPLHDGEASPHV